MRYNFKKLLFIAGMLIAWFSYGQEIMQYQYKRPIEGVSELWHKIELPDALFEKTNNNLSDIRIVGVTGQQDTVEVPYLLNILNEQLVRKEIGFNLLNQSKKQNNHIFILEIPSREEINRIRLSFQEKNFDWRLSLEGSQNFDDWYSIMDDYRIVSIQNQWTDYSFTSIRFPKSLYRYYRISIEADTKPNLLSAGVIKEEVEPGTYKKYSIEHQERLDDKKRKETVLNVTLNNAVPVSAFQPIVLDTIDYYRTVSIQYVSDSSQSPKGWIYQYRTAYTGVLSSFEKNEFTFSNVIASKWRMVIDNQDNASLKLGSVELKGSVHEIIARFPEAGVYFLMYGNDEAFPPAYDLKIFKDNIPNNIARVEIGEEQRHFSKELAKTNPLFQNQLWLWGIMGVIIIVLGIFSVRMIRKAE